MRGFVAFLVKILMLSMVVLLFSALGWLGIMPHKAVQVLLNTLFAGAALFLLADIMISTRLQHRK